MAHGDAPDGNWRGNWRKEWVASTLHTTSEHGVSSITTADAHTSAASSRLKWHPRRFKWTRQFRRKTKSVFCTCAITFQTQSTIAYSLLQIFPARRPVRVASQEATYGREIILCTKLTYGRNTVHCSRIVFKSEFKKMTDKMDPSKAFTTKASVWRLLLSAQIWNKYSPDSHKVCCFL